MAIGGLNTLTMIYRQMPTILQRYIIYLMIYAQSTAKGHIRVKTNAVFTVEDNNNNNSENLARLT